MVTKGGRVIFDFKPEEIPGIKVTFELDDKFFSHMTRAKQKKRSTFNSRKRTCSKSKKGR